MRGRGLDFQLVCRVHGYWTQSSQPMVRPQMGPALETQPALFPPSFLPSLTDSSTPSLPHASVHRRSSPRQELPCLDAASRAPCRHAGPQFWGAGGAGASTVRQWRTAGRSVSALSALKLEERQEARESHILLRGSRVPEDAGAARGSLRTQGRPALWQVLPSGPSGSRSPCSPGWGILATTDLSLLLLQALPSPPGVVRHPHSSRRDRAPSSCPALILGPRPALHTRSPQP